MIRPASGRSKPPIRRSVVVLPEPDGPSIVKNSPRRISRSSPSTARTSPYLFVSPSSSTAAAAGLAPGALSAVAAAGSDKRLLQDLQPALEILLRHDEWTEHAHDVAAQPAREQHEAAFAGAGDGRRGQLGRGLLRLAVMDELERQ